MKTLWAITLVSGLVGSTNTSSAGEFVGAQNGVRIAQVACEQVISCGTKDGKRKEYPTPCAATRMGDTRHP